MYVCAYCRMVRSMIKTVIGPIFPFIRATPMIVWFFRAMGAKIGKNVIIDSANIFDWDLLEIGDDVREWPPTLIISNSDSLCLWSGLQDSRRWVTLISAS